MRRESHRPGRRSVSLVPALVVCVVLFILGAGSGARLRSSSRSGGKVETAGPTALVKQPESILSEATLSASTGVKEAGPLSDQLGRLTQWLREARGLAARDDERSADLFGQANGMWLSMKTEAFQESAELFCFLRAPENRDVMEEMLKLVMNYSLQPNGCSRSGGPEVPREIDQGLSRMLMDGSHEERLAVMRVGEVDAQAGNLSTFGDAWVELLFWEQNPDILCELLGAVNDEMVHFGRDFGGRIKGPEPILAVWQRCGDWKVRLSCLRALAVMPGSAWHTSFQERLDDALREAVGVQHRDIAFILDRSMRYAREEEIARFIPAVRAAMIGVPHHDSFLAFGDVALLLPSSDMVSVFQETFERNATPAIRAAVKRVLEALHAGETRTDVLKAALRGSEE